MANRHITGVIFANLLCALLLFILTTQALPIGLQKFLTGNNYQVVSGPKEFVSKYDQTDEGEMVRLPMESSKNSDYIVYGKVFVLKRKANTNMLNQNEETNVIVPNSSSKHYTLRQNANSQNPEESFETESIVFPKEIEGQNIAYKRFDYDNPADDNHRQAYKSSGTNKGRVEPVAITMLPRRISSPLLAQDQDHAPTMNAVVKVENSQQEQSLGAVSIQDLEKWADAFRTSTTLAPDIENDNTNANESDVSFQSLFIVPSLKNGGCPEGKRKNHAGVCVTPYTHRGNRNKADEGSRGKPVTSPSASSRPIQSTLSSLMESLRAVELQSLQALLGSSADNKDNSDSTTTTEGSQIIAIGSRHDFPTTDVTEENESSSTSTSTTPRPNHFRSILQPLKRQSHRNSYLTYEPSTEKSILEILQDYGKIKFDFPQLQRNTAYRH